MPSVTVAKVRPVQHAREGSLEEGGPFSVSSVPVVPAAATTGVGPAGE